MIRVLAGDCRDVLPTLEAESFDCVLTSPPYWGLRDYGAAGQIGLEPTLDGYIEAIAGVARELWRVLKPSGTFWLNLGDCYATGAGRVGEHPGGGRQGERWRGGHERKHGQVGPMTQPNRLPQRGLKPKDLCLVPSRVALRLQADGWWLRSKIIWAKPNPMPESVTDRPTSAYEEVLLLTKSERYFYDAKAIEERAVAAEIGAMDGGPQRALDGSNANGGRNFRPGKSGNKARHYGKGNGERPDDHLGSGIPWEGFTRNARNVWTIATQPYPGAHFAVMPAKLAERCILAGCPEGGHVLDPFGGAGTTGLVADRLGRNATLIDLKADYCLQAIERCRADAPLLVEVSV